jgi:drug/metabolite transporter (DMT)-like permease
MVLPLIMLLGVGIGWGMTMPLTKIAVSTGYAPLGIIPWQFVVVGTVLGALIWARGIRVPVDRAALLFYAMIALLGTLIPNSFSYLAAANLPAGIMALIIATVPMFAMLIALPLGNERFEVRRFVGVVLGTAAMVLLAAPETSLPDQSKLIFLFVALIAPFCYGLEGNYIARFAPPTINPIAALFGASVLGFAVSGPVSVMLGHWIPLPEIARSGAWAQAEWGILGTSVCHAIAYAGYIWLVRSAGVVFASQIAYVVTVSGVLLSAAFLGESYAIWVWLALGLMLIGIALVRPRPAARREQHSSSQTKKIGA